MAIKSNIVTYVIFFFVISFPRKLIVVGEDIISSVDTEIIWDIGKYTPVTLFVGEALMFVVPQGANYNVRKMASEEHMNNCNFTDSINIPKKHYKNEGVEEEVYFACNRNSGRHCINNGMKLKVIFKIPEPSSQPSARPSISLSPSITQMPSLSPSITQMPSLSPSITQMPSLFDTEIIWDIGSYTPVTLFVGEALMFVVPQGANYNVRKMASEEHMNNCNFTDSINIPKKRYKNEGVEEEVYFACSRNSRTHCIDNGMKLRVIFKIPEPSSQPSVSKMPSLSPSITQMPSLSPSITQMPSSFPSHNPSMMSSLSPSISQIPSLSPSITRMPSLSPSVTQMPSSFPSYKPTTNPTESHFPTQNPTKKPTVPFESVLGLSFLLFLNFVLLASWIPISIAILLM